MSWRRVPAFVFVALLGAMLLPALPAAAATPTTTVDPATAVNEGQFVFVRGVDFPPNTDVVVVQCTASPPSPDNCDVGNADFLVANADGQVNDFFIPSRHIETFNSGGIVDCAQFGACLMAITTFDVVTFDTALIKFKGTAPAPPPLDVKAAILKDGTVVERTGVATLRGTLTCNRAAYVFVQGELSQIYQRFIFRSAFAIQITCPAAGSWAYSFRVQPGSGTFAAGDATVRFSANARANSSTAQQPERGKAVHLEASATSAGTGGTLASPCTASAPAATSAGAWASHRTAACA